MYYVVFQSLDERTRALKALRKEGIHAVFHYVPLHSSPAGLRFGRTAGSLDVTNKAADCILRLPLWVGMPDDMPEKAAQIIARTIAAEHRSGC
jgi:dTDP-4-amino-4,6-dideoxygalactose transaminase